LRRCKIYEGTEKTGNVKKLTPAEVDVLGSHVNVK